MKYTTDDCSNRLTIEPREGERNELALYSPEALEILARLWLTVGWTARDSYQFTWAGQPIIQLPHDILRYQELIWQLRPDVIVETGVAHGGSVLLSASLCKLIGKGRVIGVDIEIRPANRASIEAHSLSDLITLIEGNSIDPSVVRLVFDRIRPGESVLVLLDSNHSKAHVGAELEAYSPLVSPGSYIIAADGIMRELARVPGGSADWTWNNPYDAIREFLAVHPQFRAADPPPVFDESRGGSRLTYWPGGFLKRLPS
jgi:cephalosporin hydroxylase